MSAYENWKSWLQKKKKKRRPSFFSIFKIPDNLNVKSYIKKIFLYLKRLF